MPLKIIRNDITKMSVDAIANSTNTALKMGGGVSGDIFSAAGAEKLQEECSSIGKCNTGEAVLTSGCSLRARYIIHTVGPVWHGGNAGEAQLLHNCYANSLNLALQHHCKSIAFPLISSGIYGYPKDQALQAAISAIGEFLLKHEMTVYLVVYDKKAYALSEKLFSAIEKYIDDNYVEEHQLSDRCRNLEPYEYQQYEPCVSATLVMPKKQRSLEDVLAQLDESFSQMLLRLIDKKGMTDVETYKRANIDRKLFSKIRSSKGYNPSKITGLAFAVALELNLDETRDLLGKAGYTLSHSNKFDVIIEYFIEKGNYNIHEINEALFAFDQVLLGA
jgi:O-acetyl-ADP-ribose deacetylase (regulator of RNase III)